MKKNLIVRISAVLSAAVIFTACGGSNSAPETTSAATTPAPVQTQEPESTTSEQPITLAITWWGSQSRHDITQELLDLYTENNPHITFEATPSGWDGYFDKLSVQAAGKTLPDIMQMDYLYISTYSQNNTLADLQSFVDNGVLDFTNVDKNLYEAGRIDGKLTGAVLSSSVLTFPFNPDVVSEAGIKEPAPDWTWDEFEQMCIEVTENTEKYGWSMNVIDTNIFTYWVRQRDNKLFSDDKKSLGYDDDQIFIDFVNMVKRLQDASSVPTPDEWTQISSLGKEAGPVVTGDAFATTEWSNYGVIVSESNDNIALMTPPKNNADEKALWIKPGMFFSIAENSEYQEEAAKFVDWFINSDEANNIIKAERGVPVSSAVRDKLKTSLSVKQMEMFDYVDLAIQHSSPVDPPEPAGISEINQLFVDTVNKVMYNMATPEEAAEEFRTEANDILSRNN